MKKIILLLCSFILLSGCTIERHLHIDSDPPKAIVLIDGKIVGQTPVKIPFDFYGTREITLIKDGYHIYSHLQEVKAPLYSQFPFDFFVEVLYPFPIYENHDFTYTLKPHIPWNKPQKDNLLERAESLREKSSNLQK